MPAAHSRQQNYLLAHLPKPDFERIVPFLELVEMPLGDVLYESGGRLQHVYFPTTSIVSLPYVLENGTIDYWRNLLRNPAQTHHRPTVLKHHRPIFVCMVA